LQQRTHQLEQALKREQEEMKSKQQQQQQQQQQSLQQQSGDAQSDAERRRTQELLQAARARATASGSVPLTTATTPASAWALVGDMLAGCSWLLYVVLWFALEFAIEKVCVCVRARESGVTAWSSVCTGH
jgi:lysozyme family protein